MILSIKTDLPPSRKNTGSDTRVREWAFACLVFLKNPAWEKRSPA
jgi:hypothetical protein